MANELNIFERIVRKSNEYVVENDIKDNSDGHPFDERNIHPEISAITIKLFDNGHYSQATFEALKYIDKKVAKLAQSNQSGYKLMMSAFNESNPKIKLTVLSNQSEIDEQKGFMFLFSGSVMAIRNPRGHEVGKIETIDECLDHLSFASFLVRRISNRVSP